MEEPPKRLQPTKARERVGKKRHSASAPSRLKRNALGDGRNLWHLCHTLADE